MSRDFDGSTGRLDMPIIASLRPALPVTIAAWVRPDSLKVQAVYNNNKNGATHSGFWFVMADVSGHMETSFGDNLGAGSANRRSKVSTGTVSTGSWQHVAGRIRGAGDIDILIAGADAGGAYSGTGGAMAYNVAVAGRVAEFAGGNRFDGRVAEVGFWSVSLSDAEIVALARGVSPRMIRPGSLVAHWPVWGIASSESDLSANSNEATLGGTAPVANHAPVGCPFPVMV